jgi:L-lactate dehydrogenase complex protein LldG
MPGSVEIDPAAVELFKAKAKPVTITVAEVKDLAAAMDYAIEVTEKSPRAKLMPVSQDGAPPPDDPSRKRILAAPSIGEADYQALAAKGEAKGFEMVRSDLRRLVAGFETTFTVAELGVAETASLIAQNEGEDYRLSTMICETHVVAISKSKIVKTLYEAVPFLAQALGRDRNYTSFISGPSRTADIERVLALGVHGPLYMHVALMED